MEFSSRLESEPQFRYNTNIPLWSIFYSGTNHQSISSISSAGSSSSCVSLNPNRRKSSFTVQPFIMIKLIMSTILHLWFSRSVSHLLISFKTILYFIIHFLMKTNKASLKRCSFYFFDSRVSLCYLHDSNAIRKSILKSFFITCQGHISNGV